ncbi:TerC family protein [Halalkalibacterium halodurans]|uniref:BH2860 protein n=2 Tax=Halalkalibacterium halodurans TaxID=86665 RepID=Q9K8Z2_HALH5|nr:TerC family protein [Halalkalibacterium halodurans]MDY7223412.1 TerC family protein [Halalkalibacterium halodurans]MDY7242633.1 TerC family protein [Halalkalibacterium halodurans]MED4081660.1 TerC family protein [Halalkalibacterium halodurans]MED4085213.1 TerC family protein [Halalkalibacterium halodurans]MED4104185.1 TerC family protein [Halalkalibacterium halodurans]
MFDLDFILSVITIIGIDLILGGDNAIVVALACRHLPKQQRNKAIMIGIGLALLVRVLLTMVAVQLLEIPFLLGIGGALLIYIAFQLLVDNNSEQEISTGPTLGSAIKAIVIADCVMGFDNVLAIAGASHGNPILVITGLLISVPIIIWGSKLILVLFDTFPIIVYIGAGILAFTASRMITHEPMLAPLFINQPGFMIFFQVTVIAFVLALGYTCKNKKKSHLA